MELVGIARLASPSERSLIGDRHGLAGGSIEYRPELRPEEEQPALFPLQ
jgi:hypothetical protein